MLLTTAAGRLGKDAEIRDAGSNSVCGFTLAVDVGYGDRKETYWIDCSLWGTRGDKLCSYLTKGTSVTVAGRTTLRTYTKKDGGPGATLQIDVLELTFGGKGDGESGARRPQGSDRPAPSRQADTFDDDIPF